MLKLFLCVYGEGYVASLNLAPFGVALKDLWFILSLGNNPLNLKWKGLVLLLIFLSLYFRCLPLWHGHFSYSPLWIIVYMVSSGFLAGQVLLPWCSFHEGGTKILPQPPFCVCVSCIRYEQPPSVAGSTTTCQEASTPWVSTWSTSSCMVASPSSRWTSSRCCLVVCSTPVRAGGYTWRPELPCWRLCCLLSILCTLSVWVSPTCDSLCVCGTCVCHLVFRNGLFVCSSWWQSTHHNVFREYMILSLSDIWHSGFLGQRTLSLWANNGYQTERLSHQSVLWSWVALSVKPVDNFKGKNINIASFCSLKTSS